MVTIMEHQSMAWRHWGECRGECAGTKEAKPCWVARHQQPHHHELMMFPWLMLLYYTSDHPRLLDGQADCKHETALQECIGDREWRSYKSRTLSSRVRR